MAIQNPTIDTGIAPIDSARRAIERAELEANGALVDIRNAARAYLMEAEGQELIDRATFIYWNVPEVTTSLIASVVIGDPNQGHKLIRLLNSTAKMLPCGGCGKQCAVSSRSKLAEIGRDTRRGWNSGFRCEDCAKNNVAEGRVYLERRLRVEALRIEALRTMPYREYLVTEEWLQKRNQKLKQARFKCQLCNFGGLLNVHHRTYERRGCEEMSDLTVLCRDCHGKFHDKMP